VSSTTVNLPEPGDMLIALNCMRAWESQFVRGKIGDWILVGEQVFVISTTMVGNQIRLFVIRDNRIMTFSSLPHVVCRNWNIVKSVTGNHASDSL